MGVNREYLPYAAAVMRSCLDHRPDGGLRFHLLHDDGIGPDDLDQLRRWVEGEGADVGALPLEGSVVDTLPASRIFRPIVSMRLLLPLLLPDVARVLYLDADTIVCDSLSPLWQVDLGQLPIGAVHNVVEPEMAAHVRDLGLDPAAVFNSGVLLMDLAMMRDDGSVEVLLEFGARHRDQLWWPDQDVLNLGFAGRWHALHPRWNAQNSLSSLPVLAATVFAPGELEAAIRAPGIRHFEGPSTCKPWHYLCTSPQWREFRGALARTPWAAEARPVDRTAATRLIRRLPESRQLSAYRFLVRLRAKAARLRAKVRARAR